MFLVRFFSLFLFSVFFCSFQSAFSEVAVRTSVCDLEHSDSFFVSFDFEVGDGEHLTAPVGKGKSIAPNISWENAEVVDVFWAKSEQLLDSDGQKSGYWGYSSNFSILYHLKAMNKKPIKYHLSYVTCGDSCVPSQSDCTLELNGTLSNEEIRSVITLEQSSALEFNFLIMIFCAIIGGLIMNCMPCIFPIISIKIFSILKSARAKKNEVRKQCIYFSAGTVSIFLLLGIIFASLRQVITNIGWGFYMQNPICVFILLIVFLLCSLHFFEILHFELFKINKIKVPVKNTYIASFFNGVLCGIVSSSCVGPFVGIAVAGAILYGNFIQSIVILASFGIGLSLPFLLLSIFPGFVNKIPKPGAWLILFKKLMGFAMLFSCIWPIWILMSQISNLDVVCTIFSIISVAMFCWILKQVKSLKIIPITGLLLSLLGGIYNLIPNSSEHESIMWKDYSDEIFDNAKLEKLPIFLDFTASWCLNCQFNERLFNDHDIVEYFNKNKIIAIKCDWTNRNMKINTLMREHGAVAVPLYVYYPGNNKNYVILPSMLTKASLLKILNEKKDGKE